MRGRFLARPGTRHWRWTAKSRANLLEAPVEPRRLAIDRATAQPGGTGPAVPGNDPVVEGEPHLGQVLVVIRAGWQSLEPPAEVVAKEADEAADERRQVR